MGAKHTPGPWRAFQRPAEEGTNYWRIAFKNEESDSLAGYCGEANATLIAAAPDLLEALASVLPHAERWAQELGEIDERTGVSEHSIEAWRAVESARAAIAKAKGES